MGEQQAGFDCGPAGAWVAADSSLVKGPVCDWVPISETAPRRYGDPSPPTPDTDKEELEMQRDEMPGVWVPSEDFEPDNVFSESADGGSSQPDNPCPCNWQANPYHLKRCNWWHCGPAAKGTNAAGKIEYYRNKQGNEHVSDYNALVAVGGSKMWMTLDTARALTWVMSGACFTAGCEQVKTYSGMFIPAMPPKPGPIDLLEAGIFQILSMVGLDGHTMVNLGGKSAMGAPFQFGILDLGTLAPMSFNHTGAVGLAWWEENWPWNLLIIDPMLAVLDFMRCGNIFYPIPMAPIPIPKNFPMWGLPPFFPTGYILKFAFFFGDTGGCFFLGGAPGALRRSSMASVMIMPLPGIKLLAPSWMFMVGGVKIGQSSLQPCLITPMCRGHFTTGLFSINGPLMPMLSMLEAVAAPLTCEHIEILPEVSFILMGKRFTMQRQDYTIMGWSFDSVQCMTAFTPEFQLIPGMDLWSFGDAFVRAFYLRLDVQPVRKAKIGLADQPYYEKNGCSGNGVGPVAKLTKPPEGQTWDRKKSDALQTAVKERSLEGKGMHWKRRMNWEADLRGIEANRAEEGKRKKLKQPDCVPQDSGDMRFRLGGGACVGGEHYPELERMLEARNHEAASLDDGPGIHSATDEMFNSPGLQKLADQSPLILLQSKTSTKGLRGSRSQLTPKPQTVDEVFRYPAGAPPEDVAVRDLLLASLAPVINTSSIQLPKAFGSRLSREDDLALTTKFLRSLPRPLQRALANQTGDVLNSSSLLTANATDADVLGVFGESDLQRFQSLGRSSQQKLAAQSQKQVNELVLGLTMALARRRADRIQQGTEPQPHQLPPSMLAKTAPQHVELGWNEVGQLTDLKAQLEHHTVPTPGRSSNYDDDGTDAIATDSRPQAVQEMAEIVRRQNQALAGDEQLGELIRSLAPSSSRSSGASDIGELLTGPEPATSMLQEQSSGRSVSLQERVAHHIFGRHEQGTGTSSVFVHVPHEFDGEDGLERLHKLADAMLLQASDVECAALP